MSKDKTEVKKIFHPRLVGNGYDCLVEMKDGARFSFLIIPVHGLDASEEQVDAGLHEVIKRIAP